MAEAGTRRGAGTVTRGWDYVLVGGGIVGLSTALALSRRQPGARLVVLEKEARIAAHQTGHNSGVIHSGIYYRPGSLKARYAVAGNRSMAAFCAEHGIRHEICGKIIVATEPHELPRLETLAQRALANGVAVRRLDAAELREFEPHVAGLAALHVPTAGIVDYRDVATAYARILEAGGVEVHTGAEVLGVVESGNGVVVETRRGSYEGRVLVNCAGLHSDRIARLGGMATDFRIVPFRGEYYELKPERRHLVRNLIYPVPDPAFPFLGVHFTRMIDGTVHAGPNAVLSLRREGYRKRAFAWRDAVDVFGFGGFWRLARRHYAEGAREVHRSLSRAAFVRSLQRLIPAVTADDVVPTHAGVRAQALQRDGTLVDDFLVLRGRHSVHVCNAPSPAATASLEIGEAIADHLAEPKLMELT